MIEPNCLYEFDGDNFLCFWVKGHVDAKEFCDGVLHFEESVVEPQQIKHEYWRRLGNKVLKAEGKGYGAFPVTTCGGW